MRLSATLAGSELEEEAAFTDAFFASCFLVCLRRLFLALCALLLAQKEIGPL